jgi:hypothetical protein
VQTDFRWRFRAGLIVAMVMVAAAAADAQAVVASASGGASFVTGIGNRDRAFHFGGGVEVGSGPLRLGGEAGVVHLPAKTTTFHTPHGDGGGTMPAVSVGAFSFRASSYPVRFARSRLQPFVTGGMTYYSDAEPFATLDAGGGFDWWSTRHAGLRVEVREQYGSFFAARVGLVLR